MNKNDGLFLLSILCITLFIIALTLQKRNDDLEKQLFETYNQKTEILFENTILKQHLNNTIQTIEKSEAE